LLELPKLVQTIILAGPAQAKILLFVFILNNVRIGYFSKGLNLNFLTDQIAPSIGKFLNFPAPNPTIRD
jgi:hypothetical protein